MTQQITAQLLKGGLTVDASGNVTAIGTFVDAKTGTIKASDGTTAITIADSTGVVTIADLTVSGTETILNTTTVEVEDNILQLNTTQASPDTATATTSGITVYRGDGVTQASLIFDDADDTWDLTNNLVVAGTTTITGASTLTGNVTASGTLTVTGITTHNGDVVMNKNKKLKQQGAFMQSSTHQAMILGG